MCCVIIPTKKIHESTSYIFNADQIINLNDFKLENRLIYYEFGFWCWNSSKIWIKYSIEGLFNFRQNCYFWVKFVCNRYVLWDRRLYSNAFENVNECERWNLCVLLSEQQLNNDWLWFGWNIASNCKWRVFLFHSIRMRSTLSLSLVRFEIQWNA